MLKYKPRLHFLPDSRDSVSKQDRQYRTGFWLHERMRSSMGYAIRTVCFCHLYSLNILCFWMTKLTGAAAERLHVHLLVSAHTPPANQLV